MNDLGAVDLAGYLAAAATLVAFAQREILPMRAAALGANLFFIAYGALGPFYPVLLLHLVLLPLNAKRFRDQWRVGRPRAGDPSAPMPLLEEWRAGHSGGQHHA